MSQACVLVAESIDAIRQTMLAEMKSGHDVDPWDEEDQGLGWLDNEIGMFDRLWRRVHNDFKSIDFLALPSVAIAADTLQQKSMDYLSKLHRFMINGGSGLRLVARLMTDAQILAYLEGTDESEVQK